VSAQDSPEPGSTPLPGPNAEGTGATPLGPPWSPLEVEIKSREIIRDLEAAMAPFDAFDVLTNLWFHEVFWPSTSMGKDEALDGDREGEGEGTEHRGARLLPLLEYAVEILRHRPGRQGSESDRSPIANTTAKAWLRELRTLFDLAAFQQTRNGLPSENPGDQSVDTFSLRLQELFIRARSYAHQEKETVRALFGPKGSGPTLKALLGFDGLDVLEIVRTLTSIVESRWEKWRSHTRILADEVGQEIARVRRGEPAGDPRLQSFFESLLDLDPIRLQEEVGRFATSNTWSGIGDRLIVTAGDLSRDAGLPKATVASVLDFFSLPFGATEALVLPSVMNAARYRPILPDGSGGCFVLAVESLLWAIRPRLERELKPGRAGQQVWDVFNTQRADYVEERAMQALARGLAGARVLRNVTYPMDGRRYEVDGLVVIDTVVLIVEAKSQTMRDRSRGGDTEFLHEDLQSLVGKASTQLSRMRSLVARGGRLPLADSRGKKVGSLDCSHLKRAVAIAVTLEDLVATGLAGSPFHRNHRGPGTRAGDQPETGAKCLPGRASRAA
jgi:hypothetical protein